MNKKPTIIANWKMNLSLKETIDLVEKINEQMRAHKGEVEVVICPSFTAIKSLAEFLRKDSKIKLGAQDIFWENEGAYTGEISGLMLKEAGCEYVIVGHSERRGFLNETNEMVHKKVRAAVNMGLTPIVCVGERIEERQKGQKDYVISNQVVSIFKGVMLRPDQKVIIAYEPVWAISPGQPVAPEEAEYTSRTIKYTLLDFYDVSLVAKIFKIIYGGSVDSHNVVEFIKKENIDGALVGSASLKAEEFIKIIERVAKVAKTAD